MAIVRESVPSSSSASCSVVELESGSGYWNVRRNRVVVSLSPAMVEDGSMFCARALFAASESLVWALASNGLRGEMVNKPGTSGRLPNAAPRVVLPVVIVSVFRHMPTVGPRILERSADPRIGLSAFYSRSSGEAKS